MNAELLRIDDPVPGWEALGCTLGAQPTLKHYRCCSGVHFLAPLLAIANLRLQDLFGPSGRSGARMVAREA